jgi:hypothetical protein
VVTPAVTTLLANREMLAHLARASGIEAERLPDLLGGVECWARAPLELVERVELASKEIAVLIDPSSFLDEKTASIRHVVPARMKRRGVEMRFVVANEDPGPRRPDLTLVKALARAHRWFEDLARDRVSSLQEIARAEGVSEGYVGHILPLAFLAPEIVSAILAGTQPVTLTAQRLIKQTDLPLRWHEQRDLLDFETPR